MHVDVMYVCASWPMFVEVRGQDHGVSCLFLYFHEVLRLPGLHNCLYLMNYHYTPLSDFV